MFKKKQKLNNSRRPKIQTDGYFRRNAVVVSRSQREVAAHKQTVSQRQLDAKKRSAQHKAKVMAVVTIAIVLVVTVLLQLRINNISVTTSKPASFSGANGSESRRPLYAQSAMEYIHESVPFRQSWLLDSKLLEAHLKHSYPEIKSAKLGSGFFSTDQTLNLQFRKPAFVLLSDKSSLYIDKEGILFSNNMFPGVDTSKLPVVEDLGSGVAQSGKQIVTSAVARSIAEIYVELPRVYGKNIAISRVILPRSSREVHVALVGGQYIIKFSTDRPIAGQVGELQSLRSFQASSGMSPTEYVDLRIEGRAYFK